ncbi:hypothetical protein D3C81_2002580 [compost metagenome]
MRREHGGRLVKYKDIRAAEQNFHNLDPLLHPDGNIVDFRVGVHLKTILLRQFRHLGGRRFIVDIKSLFRFHAKNDILGNRKRLYKLEMLVNHTDA